MPRILDFNLVVVRTFQFHLGNILSDFFRLSKIFFDFFPVGIGRRLVFAPTAAAVVDSGEGFKITACKRCGFVPFEVGFADTTRKGRVENLLMISLDTRVLEVSRADLVDSKGGFFFIDCFRIAA